MGLPKPYYENELGRLYHGSCVEIMPYLETVDFIFTDPPYPKEYLYLYGELSKYSKILLKPNGLIFVYAGNDYIPEVVSLLSEHLKYRCMVVLEHAQSQILFSSRYNARWKPIFVFCNGEWKNLPIVDGSIPPSGRDKRFHVWGQSAYEVLRILNKQTQKTDVILDPFVGGGSTIIGCERLKRKWIGIEIQEKNCDITVKRIENELKQKQLFEGTPCENISVDFRKQRLTQQNLL